MKSALLPAVLAVLITATPERQEKPAVRDEVFRGRQAWVLENGRIRVTLLRDGGHIAEIRLIADDRQPGISPMYVPSRRGYAGHLVCFPYYGPASPDERKIGLGGHGEAGSVEWRQTRAPTVSDQVLNFHYGADLPHTQYRIERSVRIRRDESVLRIEESIENLADYDRPYNWNQHATFGAPFVDPDATVLDMSGVRGMTDPRRTGNGQWAAGQEFRWPDAPRRDGTTVSLREFRAVPDGQVYTPVLGAPSGLAWFTLYNPKHRLLVGYAFPAAEHPWIIDWQNRPVAGSSEGVARGIEFGTSPFDEGLRQSVERGRLFDVPTYRWIAARAKLSTTFTIFLTEIPAGFAGVEGVEMDGDRLVLRERGTGKRHTVGFPLPASSSQRRFQLPVPSRSD